MATSTVGIALERGIDDPLPQLWDLRPLSVRRTVTMNGTPDPDWASGVLLSGSARDVAVDGQGNIAWEHTAQLSARADGAGFLLTIDVSDDSHRRSLTEELKGRNIGPGFRGHISKLQNSYDPNSLIGCMLDELSGMRHVAGYGRIVAAPPLPGFLANSPQVGTCAGWRAGGVAATAHDQHILGVLPHAPTIHELVEDGPAWHYEDEVPFGTMQRRRLLDIYRGENASVKIEMWFRDSLHRAIADDGALHEYVVTGELDAAGVLVKAHATPRTLPMGDCPLAAEHVTLLLGRTPNELDEGVRQHLRGELGCTHLNDAMRFIRSTDVMLNQLS
ncbi:MAG: DUF2889 domain-containing protein [Actinobacteria bacterium]|uniref:Unannotated protein n=1 Tax=freshwater metagenome TaxID=449393 RepID=A0A6J7F3P0_9ZZZZ|nr:DUF2889 domain-containing protein [Actinomycetota bacterium]MTB27656.1 DUF2889 domain-containing protein [Actinomycetota bacterium]